MTQNKCEVQLATESSGQVEIEAADQVEVGQWYWVNSTNYKGEPKRWLGCVVHIGSNYFLLQAPKIPNGLSSSERIHFDELYTRMEFEPNALEIAHNKSLEYQQESHHLLLKIQEVTARLGVNENVGRIGQGGDQNNALMVMSGVNDVELYKDDLEQTKEKVLPQLYDELKKANENMAYWLSAPAVPFEGQIVSMNHYVGKIDERIFNISIYAGLTEQIVQCRRGECADVRDKVHVLQRRLYMDEECLAHYQTGGMEFGNIEEFDAWICKTENRDRILPFPKCLVAMRVRRKRKDREDFDESGMSAFIKFQLDQANKTTFLYLRNGENIYRLNTDLDFDEMIFPDQTDYDPSEPMMFKRYASSIRDFMPKRTYDDLCQQEDEEERLSQQWKADNPDKDHWENPHRRSTSERVKTSWTPFDDRSVYFDDASKVIEDRFKKYNQIAMLLQGLFDRSEVFNPHPPVKLYRPDGFAAALKLVYDATHTLYHGDPPDFEAYRAKCNETIGEGTVVTGHRYYWLTVEAQRHKEKMSKRIRDYSRDYTTYKPSGNPGPERVAAIEKWMPRAKKAVFRWLKERTEWSYDDLVPAKLEVPMEYLFNVDAYQPGDFKQFFADPRTRVHYLKWAPILLAAEEYKANL